ncbi:MAG: hypothetical protein Q4F57_08725 [Weeksellaceae bacterium]|nr:hypothetical protein [Weeksellaceae bacterium]
MNQVLKSILKAVGYAVLGLLLINLFYFLLEVFQTDTSDSWSFAFGNGTFQVNDKLVGLKLGSPAANGIMLLIFLITLLIDYRKKHYQIS